MYNDIYVHKCVQYVYTYICTICILDYFEIMHLQQREFKFVLFHNFI